MSRNLRIGLILIVTVLASFLGVIVLHKTDPGILLFDAAGEGDLAAVKSLIEKGAPINYVFRMQFGFTPLICAIFHHQTNVVFYLVDSGADVNLPSQSGETPLMWLTSSRDEAVPMVEYLIAHGARLDLKDKLGSTVFDFARAEPPAPQLVEVLETARQEQKK